MSEFLAPTEEEYLGLEQLVGDARSVAIRIDIQPWPQRAFADPSPANYAAQATVQAMEEEIQTLRAIDYWRHQEGDESFWAGDLERKRAILTTYPGAIAHFAIEHYIADQRNRDETAAAHRNSGRNAAINARFLPADYR